VCDDLEVRRHLAWLIAIPLSVIGTLAGHSVGYLAAVPDTQERAHVLAASGHGYLDYAPLAIGLCLAITVLGFVTTLLATVCGRPMVGRGPQVKFVAAVAPLAFVLQELIERYAHTGHVHLGLVTSAPFLLGLATQLPFALLAAAISFALATAAQRVGLALRAARRPRARAGAGAGAVRRLSWLGVDLPREPVPARGYAGRGPPLLA
jgi:hypothetical protein